MIALQPVVEKENVVSRVDKIHPDMQSFAVQALVRTLIDMLHANIVTTDVQPLMNKETGQVLFIDFTEAQKMTFPNPSFMDLALASSFCIREESTCHYPYMSYCVNKKSCSILHR